MSASSKTFKLHYCPKCGAGSLVFKELWKNHSICFDYENGTLSAGYAKQEGDPYKVEAICRACCYEW